MNEAPSPRWTFALLLVVAPGIGCFPTLPPCDDGCSLDTDPATTTSQTDPAPTTLDPSSSATTGAVDDDTTAGESGTDSRGDSGTDGSTDSGATAESGETTETGGPRDPCDAALADLAYLPGTYEIVSDKFAARLPVDGEGDAYLMEHCASSSDLLYHSPTNVERGLGVATFPSWNAFDDQVTVNVIEEGPLMVQLELVWSVDTFGDPTPEASGTSTYTYLADGRIVRDESLTYTASAQPSEGWWLVAFASFDADQIHWVEGTGDIAFTHVVAPNRGLDYETILHSGTALQQGSMCVATQVDDVVGIAAVADPLAPPTEWAGLRATEQATNGARAVALQADFARGGPPNDPIAPGSYRAQLLTVVGGSPGGDCDTVFAHTAPFLNPPSVDLVGGNASMSSLPFSHRTAAHGIDVLGSTTIELQLAEQSPTTLFDLFDTTTSGLHVTAVRVDGIELESWQYRVQDAMAIGHHQYLLIGEPLAPGVSLQIDVDD